MEDPDILIHPRKGKKEQDVPPVGLLLVNTTEARKGAERLLENGGQDQFLFNAKLVVDHQRGGFVAGPAIGAPMAVMTMEKLIALGAQRIVLCGWCGAISPLRQVGDVLVPDSALAGEGTSKYYPCAGADTVDSAFAAEIREHLNGHDLMTTDSKIWSTDGIYRESRTMLNRLYKEHGVEAVDMEFSALCAAARFRGIRFAGVLIVSDLLYEESWKPGFGSQRFKQRSQQVLDLMLEFCRKN